MRTKTLLTIPLFLVMAGSIYLSVDTYKMVKAKENLEHPSQITMRVLEDIPEENNMVFMPEEIEEPMHEEESLPEESDQETTAEEADESETEEETLQTTSAGQVSEEQEMETAETSVAADTSAPVLTLAKNRVEIKVGEPFNVMSVIEDITDDVNDRSELLRRVCVHGQYNLQAAGTYELQYEAFDTDGNYSEPVVLTLVVSE